MDLIAYSLARKFTEDTSISLGAVKGAPCTITSIEENDDNSVVTFKWTGSDGTEQTRTMTVENGEDGATLKSIERDNSNNTIKYTMSDGSVHIIPDVAAESEDVEYVNTEFSTIKNVKQALDKVLSEPNGNLNETFTPNVAIGQVKVGTAYAAGTSLEEIIKDMLTEEIAPKISIAINPNKTLYDEVSESIDSLTINAIVEKKTNDIAKIEFYVNNAVVKSITSGAAAGGTYQYIYNNVINDDTNIKVVVTDVSDLTANATKSIEFIGNSYYGLIDANTSEVNEALVKTLNKTLKNSKKYVYSGITTAWGKICYAYPAELGKLTSIMDKVNNFNYTNSFQVATKTVDGIEYYVYTLIDPTGADNVTLTFE